MAGKSVTVQSVKRALDILDCFSGNAAELGITELSAMMGLSKSTMFGLINTLVTEGYLEQNPENKKYRLGLKLLEMGSIVQRRMDIRQIAKPYMERLSESCRMTVHLAVYSAGEMVYIDKVDAPGAMIMYSQVGKRAPMHCTGIGKATLAYLPEKDRQWAYSHCDFKKYTENTVTSPQKLETVLEKIRIKKYACDDEEIELGLRCVAVPLLNAQAYPVAAFSVSGPAAHMDARLREKISRDMIQMGIEISRRLGYTLSTY